MQLGVRCRIVFLVAIQGGQHFGPTSAGASIPTSRLKTCYYMPCSINTCISKINIFISVRELSRTKGLILLQHDSLANKLAQEHPTFEEKNYDRAQNKHLFLNLSRHPQDRLHRLVSFG